MPKIERQNHVAPGATEQATAMPAETEQDIEALKEMRTICALLLGEIDAESQDLKGALRVIGSKIQEYELQDI